MHILVFNRWNARTAEYSCTSFLFFEPYNYQSMTILIISHYLKSSWWYIDSFHVNTDSAAKNVNLLLTHWSKTWALTDTASPLCVNFLWRPLITSGESYCCSIWKSQTACLWLPLTSLTCWLHPGCSVDRVPEQAVSWHCESHNSCTTRACGQHTYCMTGCSNLTGQLTVQLCCVITCTMCISSRRIAIFIAKN